MNHRHRTAPALLAAAALAALAACGDGPLGLPLAGEDETVAQAPIPPGPGKGLARPANVDGRASWSGSRAATDAELFVTARDRSGWQGLWQAAGTAPPGPLPRGSMAVAVFMGQRPTGGYAVEITGVERRDDVVVVLYRESAPPAGAMTTQMLTSPYAVTLVDDPGLPVRYQPVD